MESMMESTAAPAATQPSTSAVPAHVPPHLVVDFDIYGAEFLRHDPYDNMVRMRNSGLPPIFYTPRNGGHWVVIGATEAQEMIRDIERFSNDPQFNNIMRKPWSLPQQSDPPMHTAYRKIINPAFSPRSVAGMEAELRALCAEHIDGLVARGRCEFVRDFAKQFPVTVFLHMAGAPDDQRDRLLDLVERMTRGVPADRDAAGRELSDYVFGLVQERRDNPGDNLLGALVRGRVEDRPLTDDETRAMGMLLFLGGLDTVSSTLCFIMLFLGRHPGHYRQLVDNPGLIPSAVEELVRTHSVASFQRGVRADTEFLGIRFKQKDGIYFMTQLYGLDERLVDDPLRVDFSRPISPHLGFGSGPHRCVGSHLARAEVKVFLEEWVRRVPAFRIDTDEPIETRGGHVWSPLRLPLAWH